MKKVITDEQALVNIGRAVSARMAGRSYSEIARACSFEGWVCYPAAIEKICKGINMPGAGLLARLAFVLESTVDELIYNLPPKRLTVRRIPAAEKNRRSLKNSVDDLRK